MIHVGAFIGTLMAANVFAVIIPNQKKITKALIEGREPDPKFGAIGKQRSVHNTYLTLPVLVTMVGGHYPMLSAHSQAWLIVAFIIVGGACLRHAFIRHEAGDPFAKFAWTLPVMLVALAAAVWMTSPQQREALDLEVSDVEVMAIVDKHCVSCTPRVRAMRASTPRPRTSCSSPSTTCTATRSWWTSSRSRPAPCRSATRPR